MLRAVSKALSRMVHMLRELFNTFMIDTITTHQSSPTRSSQTHQLELINLYYFFQIVKERNSHWFLKNQATVASCRLTLV
jgi:hypothetical protein